MGGSKEASEDKVMVLSEGGCEAHRVLITLSHAHKVQCLKGEPTLWHAE